MLQLDFKYSQTDIARESRRIDWATADRENFNYDFTRGTIEIWYENNLVNPRWDAYCVIDFALCVNAIAEKLWKSGGSELFEFNEGEGEIRFVRSENQVSLDIDYEGSPRVSISAEAHKLAAESRRFLQAVLEDALQRHPALSKNVTFMAMRPKGNL